ncbi:MAG: hypothetical protein AAF665_01830 [Pseudomonadota bacterium]
MATVLDPPAEQLLAPQAAKDRFEPIPFAATLAAGTGAESDTHINHFPN